MLAITSGGAIPDNADFRVMLEPEDTFIGTVNEDFAVESMPGDIFQLGNLSWRILRVQRGTVRVEDAHGQPPSIPFWLGEAPARSPELSAAVAELRGEVEERLETGTGRHWIISIAGDARELSRHERRIQLLAYLADARPAARRASHPGHHRRRAVLRRGGRHAARHPLPRSAAG